MRAHIGTRIPRIDAPIRANAGKPENRLRNGNVCANPYARRAASKSELVRLLSNFSARWRRTLYETAAGMVALTPAKAGTRVPAILAKVDPMPSFLPLPTP